MLVCYRSYHFAHDTYSILKVFFAKDIVSGGGLAPRFASVLREVGQHKNHVLVRKRAGLHLMQIFEGTERSILNEEIFHHGYVYKLKSRLGFRL